MEVKKIDTNDIKVVIKKARGTLSKLSINEILSYRQAIGIVLDYYTNLANANRGSYDEFKKEEYEEALKEVNRYKELYQIVFDIIKEKVDNI